MKKWSWICPIEGCTTRGKKGVRRSRALHYGKWHIIQGHGLQHVDPIIVESVTSRGLYDHDAMNDRYVHTNHNAHNAQGVVHRRSTDAVSMQLHRCCIVFCIDTASQIGNSEK